MARVGFKKSYAAGTLDNSAVEALFGTLKTYIQNAGFNVVENSSNVIEFYPAGHAAATVDDDVPHWALTLQTGSGVSISCWAIYGVSFLDPDAKKVSMGLFGNDSYIVGNPPRDVNFWFAADGIEGWLYGHSIRNDAPSIVNTAASCVATRTRRYPSDMYKGTVCRYMLFSMYDLLIPYCKDPYTGDISPAYYTFAWTPLGLYEHGASFIRQHTPLPRMIVPAFPCIRNGAPAVIGEFTDVMLMTDGYTQEEAVMPGWIAMTGAPDDLALAVKAPSSFDQL